MDVKTEILSNWEQISSYRRHGWIFRGQSGASRLLRTSLEICFDGHRIPTVFRTVVEKELLREFKRAYRQYSSRVPSERWTLEDAEEDCAVGR